MPRPPTPMTPSPASRPSSKRAWRGRCGKRDDGLPAESRSARAAGILLALRSRDRGGRQAMTTIRTGEGSLYDADDNELSPVAYLVEGEGEPGEPIVAWSGRLTLPLAVGELSLDPGRYLLQFEDGA